MVEPLAGLFGAFAVVLAEPILPYALAFAAGAMVYVVVDDIIPEAQIRWESFPTPAHPEPVPARSPRPAPAGSLRICPSFICPFLYFCPLPKTTPIPSATGAL